MEGILEEEVRDGKPLREAQEVFIRMHRNYRASRNIRAHWLFHHLDKTIRIEADDLDKDDEYSKEMKVIGIIPKGGDGSEIVLDEHFLVTVDTKVTYISRYYRHVFVLDLSPSTIVADDDSDCCLSSRLIPTLRNTVKSATKKFRVPGTQKILQPQVYMTVCVFVPFLTFEHELTLIQGVFLTETNVDAVLDIVEEKFNKLFKALYEFSRKPLAEWGQQKRRYRNTKFESICENTNDDGHENSNSSLRHHISEKFLIPKRDTRKLTRTGSTLQRHRNPQFLMQYPRKVWKVQSEVVDPSTIPRKFQKDYIHPEWSLIFMLRIGLIATQMLPENTQSNLIVITDSVCGMPDSNALQQVLTQLRSYTIACSFIQLQRKTCSEPVFGHVGSCELFHFLTMATFGTYLPKHRSHACCANLEELHEHKSFDEATEESSENLNTYHRALVCWSFQKALGDHAFMENAFTSINPEFVALQRRGIERHRRFMTTYYATLNQLMYVRLREGFTLKSTALRDDRTVLVITLCLAFRPLVFIEYIIRCPWPIEKDQRQNIQVELIIEAPYNELKDLLTEGQYLDPERLNLTKSAIDGIIEADRLLIHIHSFDTQRYYYTIPSGVTIDYALFGSYDKNARRLPPICMGRHDENSTRSFIGFWRVLLELNDNTWQKWVHTHCERVLLTVPDLPFSVFNTKHCLEFDCSKALHKLHALIKTQSTFCLVNGHTYVTLVYGDRNENQEEIENEESSKPPDFFYMKRICDEAPVVVIKTAFLGGISSSVRREIVEEHRNRLRKLRFDTTPSELKLQTEVKSDANRPRLDTDKENVLSVIRRPLERMLVRYTEIPLDLQFIVRADEKTNDEEEIKLITLHNAISKFLSCRRSIILISPNQKEGGAYLVRNLADFIMNVIMQKRLHTEKFKAAWTNNNIISVCRQVCNSGGTSLEQFIMFPATTLAITDHKLNLKRPPTLVKKRRKMANVMPDKKWNRPLAVISEFWYEAETLELIDSPNRGALNNKSIEDRQKEDLHITSMLFTLDRVLKLCGSCLDPMSVQSPFREWNSELEEEDFDRDSGSGYSYGYYGQREACRNLKEVDLTSARNSEKIGIVENHVSPFVTVYSNLFDLYKLVQHAKRRLTSIKPFVKNEIQFSQCNTFILLSAHQQLTNICDATWIVSSEENSKICKEIYKDSNYHDLQLRVYAKGITPWMIGLIFVPIVESTFDENDADGVPLVIMTCNEAQLSYCVATQNLDEEGIVNVPIKAIPNDWFSNVRLGWRPNNNIQLPENTNTFFGFTEYISNEIVVATKIGAIYEAAKMGVEIDEELIGEMDDDCFFEFETELQSVPPTLKFLCEHFKGAKVSQENVCSKQSNIEAMFKKVLDRTFAPVLGAKCLYYLKPVKSKSSKKKHQENELKMNLKKLKDNTIPLFIQFNCSITFPNTMISFVVDFLPSCIYQVLEKCKDFADYPKEPFDVKDLEVHVELIVKTSQIQKDHQNAEIVERNEISEKGYRNPLDYMQQSRQVRFRAQKRQENEESAPNMNHLPKRERKAIQDFITNIDIMLDVEKFLVKTRCENAMTVDTLNDIKNYIDKACNAITPVGFNEKREKAILYAIKNEDNREKYLKSLENMDLGYATLRRLPNTDYYFCCKVENIEEFRKTREDPNEIIGKDLLFDFWLIITIEPIHPENSCDEKVNISFCQRYENVHSKLLECCADTVRRKLRTLNQQMLLERMMETRECDALLIGCGEILNSNDTMDTADNLDRSRDVSSMSPRFDDSSFSQPPIDKRIFKRDFHVKELPKDDILGGNNDESSFPNLPGYFACPLQRQFFFHVHRRLRELIGKAPLLYVFNKLRTFLQEYGVRNRPNTYVLRDDRKGILMYIQLHMTSDSYLKSIRNERRDKKHKEYQSDTDIAMTVFALEEPDPEFLESFVETRRQKIDGLLVDELLRTFSKNREAAILESEVEFLQPPDSPPISRSFFSIPNFFVDHLAALFYYTNQHLEALAQFPITRIKHLLTKGDSRNPSVASLSSSENPNSSAIKFKPYKPINGSLPEKFDMSTFHFYLKLPSVGVTSVGIGVMEMRLVKPNGEVFEILGQPKMNEQSHNMFVPKTPGDNSLFHRDITKTQRFDEPRNHEKSICGYLEMNLWKRGEIEERNCLDSIIQEMMEKSMFDVITEFGYLNTNLLQSTAIFTKHIEQPVEFHVLQEPNPFYIPGERSDVRRSLGGSVDYGAPKTTLSKLNSISKEFDHCLKEEILHRTPDFIDPRTAYDIINWFKFVASRHGETNSVVIDSVRFECQHALLTPLFEIRNRIEIELGGPSSGMHENVFLCGLKKSEKTHESERARESNFRGSNVSITKKKPDWVFEILTTDPFVGMTADVGVDETRENRKYLIASYMKHIFGGEDVVNLDDRKVMERQMLFRNHLHAKYEPKIRNNQFISRQRVMFALMRGDIMDVYFYNFHPNILKEVRTKIHKVAGWHNSKTRLLREIGLHKMGITHFSNFNPVDTTDEFNYEQLIWSDPTQLIAKEYPPEFMGNHKPIVEYPEYSNIFFRMYRQPNLQVTMGRSRFVFKSDCIPTNHYEQLLRWRDGLNVKVKTIRKLTETHDEFLKGKREMREEYLHEFLRPPKLPTTTSLKNPDSTQKPPRPQDEEETMSMTEKTSKRASVFGENSIKSLINQADSDIFKKRGTFLKKIELKPEPAAVLVKELRAPLMILDKWRQEYRNNLAEKEIEEINKKEQAAEEEEKEKIDRKHSKSIEKVSLKSGSSGGGEENGGERENDKEEVKEVEEVVEKKKTLFGTLIQRIRNSPKPEPSQPSTSAPSSSSTPQIPSTSPPTQADIPAFVTIPQQQQVQRTQQGAFSRARTITLNAASRLVRPFRRNSHRETREIVLNNDVEPIETGENALEIMENEMIEELKKEEEKVIYTDPPVLPILYFHANEFVKYMKETHGFTKLGVNIMCRRSMRLNRYSTNYNEKYKENPYIIMVKVYEGGIIFCELIYKIPVFIVKLYIYERATHSTADYYMIDKMMKLYAKETVKLNNEVQLLAKNLDLNLFNYDFNLRVIAKHLIDLKTKSSSIFGEFYNISNLLDSLFKYHNRKAKLSKKCSIEKDFYECTRIKNDDFWQQFVTSENDHYLMLKMRGENGVEYMLADFEEEQEDVSSEMMRMKRVFQLVSFLPRYLNFDSQFLPYYTIIVEENEEEKVAKTPLVTKRSIEERQISVSPRPSTSIEKDSTDLTQEELETDENDPNYMNLPEKRKGKWWKRKFSRWSSKQNQEKKNRIKWMDKETIKKSKKLKSMERKNEREKIGTGTTPENSEEEEENESEQEVETSDNLTISKSQSEPNICDVSSEELVQIFSNLPKSDDEDVEKIEKRKKLMKNRKDLEKRGENESSEVADQQQQ